MNDGTPQNPIISPSPGSGIPPPSSNFFQAPATPPIVPAPMSEPPKKRRARLIILILVILMALGAGGYLLTHKSKSSSTLGGQSQQSNITANVWTGGAGNYKLSDAKNWSMGTPVNGQNLKIDVADVTQPTDQYGTTGFDFQDDIPGLTINKLIITGRVGGIIFGIKGQALTISGGIEDTIVQTDTTSAVPQVELANLINFTADQTVKTTGRNFLTFYSKDDSINLADKTIQFSASDTSQIDISGAIVGTGKINLPANSIGSKATLTFDISSPDFKGSVVIGSGNRVMVGNKTITGDSFGYGSVDAFGTSAVEIMDGASMVVFAAGTNSFVINNDITISGSGVAAPGKNNPNVGASYGAINACIAKLQEGCDSGVQVTLSGKVSLTGDTQFGASFGGERGGTPSVTTVTYTLSNPVSGKHTLTAVSTSKVIIQQK